MTEIAVRFLIGGVIVSLFAALGDVLKPKTFAGLFGAAPSVALATLTLTLIKKPANYAAIECRSMVLGACGLLLYCIVVRWFLKREHAGALGASLLSSPIWFAISFALWFIIAR